MHALIYGLEDGILHDLNSTVIRDGMAEVVCAEAVERILATPGRVVD